MNISKIDLAPGCGRKLGTKWIKLAKQQLSQLEGGSTILDWSDATPLSAHDALAISIDTSVRSPTITKDFFQIAVLHAMRDLHASFYHPTDFSVSVRFDDNSVERELSEFVGAMSDICTLTGARLGKIHSLLGLGPTEITVSVIGKRLKIQPSHENDSYDLYLLGEIETGVEDTERDWKLLHQNGVAIASFTGAHIAKDVSGDGLAGALVQISEDTNLSVSIELSCVPYSSEAVPLDDCNLDRNINDYENSLSMTERLDKLNRAILMKPQFCGPLLVAVAPHELEQNPISSRFVKIGSCNSGNACVEVIV